MEDMKPEITYNGPKRTQENPGRDFKLYLTGIVFCIPMLIPPLAIFALPIMGLILLFASMAYIAVPGPMRQKNRDDKSFASCTDYGIPRRYTGILVLLGIILVSIGTAIAVNNIFLSMMSGYQLRIPFNQLESYIHKHDGQLPPAQSWYDDIMDIWNDPNYYSVALNASAYLADYNDLPDDMVILFMSDKKKNLVGGKELVRPNMNDIISVKKKDHYTYSVKMDYIETLRWSPNEEPVKPELNYGLFFITGIPAVIVFGFLLLRTGRFLWKYSIISLILTLASCGAGAFLGEVAEETYYTVFTFDFEFSLGPWIGGIVGAMAGMIYVLLMGKIQVLREYRGSMVGWCVMFGALTGAAAALITHITLLLAYRTNIWAPLGGVGYGIWAGIVLGWITSGLLRFYIPADVKAQGEALCATEGVQG